VGGLILIYDLIFSDEVEARLQQLGYQNDITAWEIGDLTEYVFHLCSRVMDDKEVLIDPQTEEPIKSSVLYNAVGKHAGKAPAAIRDYRYTSRNVPISIRHEYHMLGRHHWKALIPHAKTVEDLQWWGNQILEWAEDYNGQIISVAALRMKLAAKEDGGERAWAKTYRLARKHCDKLISYKDEEAPPPHLKDAAEHFLNAAVPLP
jgi:hypothetical protein